jgi:WD40 repeat protein
MKIIKQLYVCVLIFLVSCSSYAETDPSIPATMALSGATMIPSPISSTPANIDTPLPQLQVITAANAGELKLLKTLQIPGFQAGSLSQCSVAFSPDGRFLSGVCYQNTIPVWDAQSGQITGGPAIGALGRVVSLPLTISVCGGLLAPALVFIRRANRQAQAIRVRVDETS